MAATRLKMNNVQRRRYFYAACCRITDGFLRREGPATRRQIVDHIVTYRPTTTNSINNRLNIAAAVSRMIETGHLERATGEPPYQFIHKPTPQT